MWLILGVVGSADACLNELSAAERRYAEAKRVEVAQQQAASEVAARLERDTWRVRREVAASERRRVEAELAAAALADATWRRQVGTTGAVVGLAGAVLSAVLTTWLAVRVERAGGRKEVRYA